MRVASQQPLASLAPLNGLHDVKAISENTILPSDWRTAVYFGRSSRLAASFLASWGYGGSGIAFASDY